MHNEPNPNDPRNLWQDQEVEKVTITIDDVRRSAARFERRIRWRNLREYAAGILVIAVLVPRLWSSHGWRQAPVWLLLAGTIYVMVQLYRRGASGTLPADAGMRASLEFQRRELERQRDALRTVWSWYLLPLVPGFASVLIMMAIDRGFNAQLVFTGSLFIVVVAGIWALNQWVARKLEGRIEEMRRMEAGNE